MAEIKAHNNSIVNNSKFELTTVDNPYNPFTQFTDWWLYDTQKGYYSSAYLARIAHTSDQLSEKENNDEVERAIDEILANDILGIYRKVVNPNYHY